MKRPLVNFALIISLLLSAATLALWAASQRRSIDIRSHSSGPGRAWFVDVTSGHARWLLQRVIQPDPTPGHITDVRTKLGVSIQDPSGLVVVTGRDPSPRLPPSPL